MGKGHLSFLEDMKQIYKQILKNIRLDQHERTDSKALILAPEPVDVSVQERIGEKVREDASSVKAELPLLAAGEGLRERLSLCPLGRVTHGR